MSDIGGGSAGPKADVGPRKWGHVAEWLRSGLQIRVPQFESGRGLQFFQCVVNSGSTGTIDVTEMSTMIELLNAGKKDDPAIGGPDQRSMTFEELRALTVSVNASLKAARIGRNDRVAIVLPNGPQMATAFVSVAASATAAPLNPAYKKDEFRFYLSDLGAKALLVMDGMASAALDVATELNIPVITLTVKDSAPAGCFKLSGPAANSTSETAFAKPEDIALVLHTSGTTSRPKIVPLSHINVCTSARNIADSLQLSAEDRCLNIMPLFHIHGLIAAVLASLAAGAEVSCTPGFDAMKVFRWFDGVKPTWYTAVPTMHQAILQRAERNPDAVKRLNLRFARSSSSSLPPKVMSDLEETFGCPVIEAYGMTEAAHQMASNPLPPLARKAGSVGLAAGPEIAIMDLAGEILSNGSTGEIVIRGRNVTAGYEANPKANDEAYTKGWFRTGDQGVMDHDGYLRLTGRLKEIINRGGEKISPREVDEVLLDHPAIAQAVTFAVPDAKLGEDVGAAIVLKPGQDIGKQDVKDFVAERLAQFKVPRTVLFVDEIPKGATGKLVRIGLHEKLGL